MSKLDRIQVKGFKSIREMDLELRDINILIGANGAGKSNFLEVFTLLNDVVPALITSDNPTSRYVTEAGGAHHLLHYGRKHSESISIVLWLDEKQFNVGLRPNRYGGLSGEVSLTEPDGLQDSRRELRTFFPDAHWNVFHFQDTSDSGPIKQTPNIYDNLYLRSDAHNLASMLYLFQNTNEHYFNRIVSTIRLAIPFLDHFVLEPRPENKETIRLQWMHKDSDMLFDISDLSDGTIRFICLVTLLLQPDPPSLIIIDEPELGLHPYAETLFASMVRSVAATGKQFIISTQSVRLVDEFLPENIVVVEREKDQSTFKRQSTKDLEIWLDDYTLGELWEKNVLGGRP
jgi:predicted ATPase